MIAGGGGVGLLVLIVTLLVNGLGGSSSNPLGDLNNLLAPSAGGTGLSHCKTGADANTYEDCRIVGYVDSIQAYWAKALPASGKAYTEVQTVFFTDSADTACGARHYCDVLGERCVIRHVSSPTMFVVHKWLYIPAKDTVSRPRLAQFELPHPSDGCDPGAPLT